jgi:dTDP-4-dehydrorhamnose reductase
LLVTGGSGYLGTHLLQKARRSWQVVGTYFSHPTLPADGSSYRLDLSDRAAVHSLIARVRPHTIIHTASDMSSPASMERVIVCGTRNIAAAAAAVGARLVHMSTDMVFDGEAGPYKVGDTPRPITAYGRAKLASEQAVSELCPAAMIVRTSLIYGFDPPDPRTQWVLQCLRQNSPITLFTDELRSPVWVEQLCGALLELAYLEGRPHYSPPRGERSEDQAEAPPSEPQIWHLAGPQIISRYDFGERLARLHGLDPTGITPGLSRDSGQLRPRDCSLDVSKALGQLESPLWGVDQVLAHLAQVP